MSSEYFDTDEDKMSNKLFCFETEVANMSIASFLLDKIKSKNTFSTAAPNKRFGASGGATRPTLRVEQRPPLSSER